MTPFERSTSLRKLNKPKTKKVMAKINKIVISWSKLKLTSVAMKIIAINKKTFLPITTGKQKTIIIKILSISAMSVI